MTKLNYVLTLLERWVEVRPLWEIYLTLFLLSTVAWCLVVLGFVSIADAMMSFRLRN